MLISCLEKRFSLEERSSPSRERRTKIASTNMRTRPDLAHVSGHGPPDEVRNAGRPDRTSSAPDRRGLPPRAPRGYPAMRFSAQHCETISPAPIS